MSDFNLAWHGPSSPRLLAGLRSIPSCLLPFAQEEAGSALQVRDTLQQDPDTAPDNTVIRSKLLCR